MQSKPRKPIPTDRQGFSLIELLVVIAVIAILIALLLPAVQQAREAARRSQCKNNLKQIGLALHNFAELEQKLPPGAAWSSGKKQGSILIRLLPFVDQKPLYEAYDLKQANVDSTVIPGTTTLAASKPVSVYVCPSDNSADSYWGRSRHNYSASRGPTAVGQNPACLCNHQWQSLAMAPVDDPQQFAGPFTRVGTITQFRDVTDGLSNTIFFGEVRPMCSQHAQNGWGKTNNGNGYCTTLIPINYDTCDENAAAPCKRPCTWNTEVGFKSAHTGGAQFLLGDGSVHFISQAINHQMYQYLGAKSDGEAISNFP